MDVRLRNTRSMKALLNVVFLLFLNQARADELTRTPFSAPKGLPVSVELITPRDASKIVSHEKKGGAETVTVALTDDESGLVVEVLDSNRKSLWKHDFGYNLSAVPGCRICIESHPKLPCFIVHYYGYKWDHKHVLLMVDTRAKEPVVHEYVSQQSDLGSALKMGDGYAEDLKYFICPLRLTGDGVLFECIPLKDPDRGSAHPFAPDAQRFTVATKIKRDFKVIPEDAALRKKQGERDGARQPATAPESKSEDSEKPKAELEGCSQ